MNKRIGALVLALVMALLLIAAPLSSIVTAVENTVTIKFHYTRADGNYSAWDIWTWGAGGDQAITFVEGDGEAVATLELPANPSGVGFLVRKPDWSAKDPATDRFVEDVYADLYKVTSGTLHVYLTSGQSAFTVTADTDVVLDGEVEAPAAPGPVEVKVHYYRADGNYDGWNLFTFVGGIKTTEFEVADGEAVATIYAAANTESIGFIVRYSTSDNEWADREQSDGENGNRYVENAYPDLALVESGTIHVYVNSGSTSTTAVAGDDVYKTGDPVPTEPTETEPVETEPEATEPELTPYYVAGVGALCGSEWNPGDTNNNMTLNADGLYEKTYASVPAATYEFKVTDGTWTNSWGDNGNNYSFTVEAESNVTITFNADTKEINVILVTVDPYYVAGTDALCGTAWDPGYADNKMSLGADGLYYKTFKNVAAGTHEFKVTDGTWTNSWGDNGNNYVFTTEEAQNVTITFNAETKEINVILSEATPDDSEEEPEPVEYDITIKVHYYREDGAYSDWEVHMWNGVEALSATRPFDETDENGWAVATYYADASDTWVGFIIKKPDWTKDPDGDRKIDISNVISGTVHVYAKSGSALEDFETDKSEATLGAKITAAVYDSQTGVLTVTTSMPIEGDPNTAFTLEGPDGEMTITSVTQVGTSANYIVEYVGEINDDEVFTVYYNGAPCVVTIPNIYSTEEFEAEYTYTGNDLGATYTEGSTTFRLWAPTASEVVLNLYATGSDAEEGAADLGTYAMTQDVNGTWIVTVEGDLNGVYYTYSVTRKGETVEACDPYARTTGVNGNRAMVIDLDSTDPAGWENDTYVTVDNYTDAVIWELHVRDFSIDESSGMTNKGKYLAFTETGTTVPGTAISTGIDYMVELGVNYVHLLPVYDINSVDETVGGYNWGYDPKNYNVPEGSYSTDPYNGAVRVTEFKQMVQSLHDNGIGVIMDVVYNHVADQNSFCFNQIVPGYFSRIMDDGSSPSNSGCGNDTASERSMVSKYIVDSVLYWAEEYHIDGFRWDLVGLIDYETINAVMAAVHEVNPDIIFYGEGWEMCTWTTKEGYVDKMTIQNNADKVNNGDDVFAFFNDTVRNTLHGGVFDHTAKGFIAGIEVDDGMYTTLVESFKGASHWGSANTVCPTPLQTINYASCHDNYTLIDNITLDSPEATREQHVAMNNLAAAYYLTAQGVPFIHAGEEMLRSKPDASSETGYNHNTYAAGDEINSIKWSALETDEVMTTSKYYAGLIDFRMAHPALRQYDPAAIAESVVEQATGDNGVLAFAIDGTNVGDDEIFIVFNSKHEAYDVTLPEGNWDVYVAGDKAGTEVLDTVSGTVSVDAISTLIAVKAEEDPFEGLDTTELEAVLEQINNLNPDDYTEESIEDLVEAIFYAAMILEGEDLTQEDVDAAVEILKDALAALEPIVPETTAPEVTEPETTAPEATESETTVPETTKPGTGDNSQTGDSFQMAWFVVLAVSAMATAALIASRKKLF